MKTTYRRDIDGLRAIAVLSVVLFHMGFSSLSGGYVGVDIFFVISGYLITTIIVREIESNNFSIAKFYERRFRRILPALLVVIVFTLIAGKLLLTPERFRELNESAVTATLFSSNILFYFQTDYFDTAAKLKPLLHTWSLGVEEQYYIFFPLFLMLIAKINNHKYLGWILALTVLSLLTSIYVTNVDPDASFYLIPARMWELLIGSLLAIGILPVFHSRIIRELATVTGLLMIVFSILMFNDQTPFPGSAALLPTIGTALLLHSGSSGDSTISRLISCRIMVFFGLISYSLYLWHWPLIVYTKIFSITEPAISTMTLLFLVTVLISVLSWKYVESPFREKQILGTKRAMLKGAFIASTLLVLTGWGSVYLTPLHSDREWKHWHDCEKRSVNTQNLCQLGTESGSSTFFLWGDSHARSIASGVDKSARDANRSGQLATLSACPPLLGVDRVNRTTCEAFNQRILKHIAASKVIDTVVLTARWAISTQGTRYKLESGNPVRLERLTEGLLTNQTNGELFEEGLGNTVNALVQLGKRVVITSAIPEVGYDVPSAVQVASFRGINVNSLVGPSLNEYQSRTELVDQVLDQLTQRYPEVVTQVRVETLFKDKSGFQVEFADTPLYRDDNHLSTFGSRFISSTFDPVFKLQTLGALQH